MTNANKAIASTRAKPNIVMVKTSFLAAGFLPTAVIKAAKTLIQKNEPLIWDAIKFGSSLENVVISDQGVPDYAESKYTENTSVCYPRDFIEGAVPANQGDEPDNIIFLTCDLSGVLPPVSILNENAAA